MMATPPNPHGGGDSNSHGGGDGTALMIPSPWSYALPLSGSFFRPKMRAVCCCAAARLWQESYLRPIWSLVQRTTPKSPRRRGRGRRGGRRRDELRLFMWHYLCKLRWPKDKDFAMMTAISGTTDWERMFRKFLPECRTSDGHLEPEYYSFVYSLQGFNTCTPIALIKVKVDDATKLLIEGDTGWIDLLTQSI
mmetsp:Transcript_22495/g.48846  ORF Transcript_22495/g.48846 Transcript_22495/m.48846 type:complete len:193 (+) Transcript_22495:285-863(+)